MSPHRIKIKTSLTWGWVILAATALGGCTKANPDFEPEVDGGGGCTPGQRRCSGRTTQVCTPEGDAPLFIDERTCPADSTCQDGICLPTGPRCEETRCPTGKVCTLFVDDEDPSRLGRFCTSPAGGTPGAEPCTANDQCQSGICLGRGQSGFCYLSCNNQRECPQARGFKCKELSLTINGVQGKVAGCASSS